MLVGILTLYIRLPGCNSLKEKRGRVKPVLARLHREFNVSAAEVDRQDAWQETVIACALVSNGGSFTQRALQSVVDFTQRTWPDLELLEHHIEVI